MRQGSGCFDVPEVVRTHTEFGIDPASVRPSVPISPHPRSLRPKALSIMRCASRSPKAWRRCALSKWRLIYNTAEVFYAQRDFGVVAPGEVRRSCAVSNLWDFAIDMGHFLGGTEVFKQGKSLPSSCQRPSTQLSYAVPSNCLSPSPPTTLHSAPTMDRQDIEVRAIWVT